MKKNVLLLLLVAILALPGCGFWHHGYSHHSHHGCLDHSRLSGHNHHNHQD